MLWIPPGFAHGFLVLSETRGVPLQDHRLLAPEHERTLLWNDPALGIDWPLDGSADCSRPRTRPARRSAQAELRISP